MNEERLREVATHPTFLSQLMRKPRLQPKLLIPRLALSSLYDHTSDRWYGCAIQMAGVIEGHRGGPCSIPWSVTLPH